MFKSLSSKEDGKKLLASLIKKAVIYEISDIYIREHNSVAFKNSRGTMVSSIELDHSSIEIISEVLLGEKFLDSKGKLDKGERVLFSSDITIEKSNLDEDELNTKNSFLEELKENDVVIRVRCQMIKDFNGYFISVRILHNKVYDYKELTAYSQIDEKLEQIFKIKQGLIIIIGSTGQGKSTLVSAYLEKLIKERTPRFLKTIEEPIEHLFSETELETITLEGGKTSSNNALTFGTIVSQMEVSNEGLNYKEAILSCSRDNSDIVYIQEIASAESAKALKSILNSGKLVITTVHAAKTTQAINRLLVLMKEFDGDDIFNKRLLAQESICIIGQHLITGYVLDSKGNRRKNSKGEFIMKKYGVQELLNIGIAEKNKIIGEGPTSNNNMNDDHEKLLKQSLYDPSKGNVALNNVLIDFYKKGIIDATILISRSNDLSGLESRLAEEFNEISSKEDYKELDRFFDKRISNKKHVG